MKVAIIGGGISGLMAARQLQGQADYTLFEKNARVGGHTDTHEVVIQGDTYSVDTGFIVFNPPNYPNFSAMLEEYQVASQSSDMSFAVSNQLSGLEYNATNLAGLFCQKKNLFSFKFYGMIRDIMRFYKKAPQIMDTLDEQLTLGDYLQQEKYGDYFIEEHIIPMASALWSGDFDSVRQFPLKYLLAFMRNHNMLQIRDRPQWRTIQGGSQRYVEAMLKNLDGEFHTNTEVMMVERKPHQVVVHSNKGQAVFDQVIFACHSDQALGLIEKPSQQEQEILGDIPYTRNEITLHTDGKVMPKNKKAWASWCVMKYNDMVDRCTVSYYMNLLQNIDCPEPLIVSLNQGNKIARDKVLRTLYYHHPVYNPKSLAAQSRKQEIQGRNRSYFCGAYWGWGFHEDGARSAVEAVDVMMQEYANANAA